ncbi:GAF and ANTAR domain-containing protein [Amycolatopsis sp. NPDC051128]|uniref:GAF and ANTAR domain-containing protein n=1 Tax=Amycolatopsis sp. NPDC051128 TaxID=3155412 RepID=UPI003446964A
MGQAYNGPAEKNERRLFETFVELADTLIDGFDVVEFLHLLTDRCVELLNVDAAGLLLADQHGKLRLAATSNEQACVLELTQLQNNEGPGLDAFDTGSRVSHGALAEGDTPWPRFATAATEAGFGAVDALPMRRRGKVVGALNLFHARPGGLSSDAIEAAQTLADMATIGLLQERSIRRHEILARQLQTALSSRVTIEQAKGVLAERLGITMDSAFAMLRRDARNRNLKLAVVAHAVVTGRTSVSGLTSGPPLARSARR